MAVGRERPLFPWLFPTAQGRRDWESGGWGGHRRDFGEGSVVVKLGPFLGP